MACEFKQISGAGGLEFKSRTGQIKHRLTMARHRCDVFSKEALLPGRNEAEMRPANLPDA